VPVGIQIGYNYSLQECKFSPHTTLFLYTDGLTEATRSNGQLFGEDRVQECLSHFNESVSAKDQIAQMTEAVGEFVGNAEQSDDLTMLIIKYSFN
jgi:sigma-B regulation protein RsbU (phosphoserine phosphatase)